jgi:CO/xanthine dehydrogenase FAD-binding subunit
VTAAPLVQAPAGLEAARMVRPKTLAEACELLAQAVRAEERAVLLAGGTDLIVDRHMLPPERATTIDLVVDVSGLKELCRVVLQEEEGEPRLVLGGGVTYWQLRTNRVVASAIPMLAAMAGEVGAVQIQTRGTLAGNLATASPAADGSPALLALDGVVRLVSEEGERRVPLAEFFTGYRKTALTPEELIADITLRVPPKSARVTFRKVGTRQAQSISKVALAAVVETSEEGLITRARFAFASVAATTFLAKGLAAAVEGKALVSLDRAAVEAAVASELKPIDDVRSTGEYRLHVAKALAWNALAG